MIENSLTTLSASMSRYAIASTFSIGRAMTSLLLQGTADVLGLAADALSGPPKCSCSKTEGQPPQADGGSGWGPVRQDS